MPSSQIYGTSSPGSMSTSVDLAREAYLAKHEDEESTHRSKKDKRESRNIEKSE